MIYRCNNTLFKYLLTFDVDKCVKFGEELKSNRKLDYDKLNDYEKNDINHTLGTAYGLEGTSHEQSFKCYNECLEIADKHNEKISKQEERIGKGYALNNLGIGRFWYFMEKAKELSKDGEPDKAKLEKHVAP